MSGHTATPWTYDCTTQEIISVPARRYLVASMVDGGDGKFIVRACNNHYDLAICDEAGNPVDGEVRYPPYERSLAKARCEDLNESHCGSEIRAAMLDIVNAANANPVPIHYKVKEAIDRAREAIQ